MPDTVEVNQKAAIGSETTQIAVQNNISGLSVADAMQMALTMFREYYPQLRREALADVEQMVTEKLSNLCAEDIVQPSPRIVVPALQNASITEEKELRALYANLLANSMNRIAKDGIHPGFVEVIKQLSPDEAKILVQIYAKKTIPIITLRSENGKGEGINIVTDFSNIGELAKCEKPLDSKIYFDNLIRLGLIENSILSSLSDKSLYEPLKSHPFILKKVEQIKASKGMFNQPEFAEKYISLTDYGSVFCEKCVINIVTIRLPTID